MKNIKVLFALLLFAGIFNSCSDAYEIVQPGELYPIDAIQNVNDMNSALISLYDQVYPDDEIAFTSYFTDETAIGIDNGGQSLPEYRFNLLATNSYVRAIWLNNYNLIVSANRIIQLSDNVVLDPESASFEDDTIEKNRILAEVRTLRALGFIQLEAYFSTDMTDDNALGVMLLDHVPSDLPNKEMLPRVENGLIYAFINEDLDFAEDNLQANSSALVTQQLVTGLRARLALYRAKYAEALTYADEVINQYPATSQGLASANSYPSIWDNSSSSEIIFGLERPSGKPGIASNWYFNEVSISGGAYMEVSRSLYNAYPNNDVRRGVVVLDGSVISPNYSTVFDYRGQDILLPGKYPGVAQLPLNNRVPVMRTAEIHLIKAEAQVGLGDLDGALTTLNFLRSRRISSGSALSAFTTQQDGFAAVLKERRLELAFEGFRYIDLHRLGTLAGVSSVDRYERDCEPYGACTLSVTDYRFTLPIPQAEINGNNVIADQQNPGY
ncbi:RagB/SusD family nutrient uptake outer membrane protein [Flavobacterium rhizosphaerae]|uniref:RagB/SusD family nutrient uptake outer membrane protein n=1 Tax=Flavobacterium rhizosphaerae TaxID=3163298 RepID=A0ABW8YUS2_9FLAO